MSNTPNPTNPTNPTPLALSTNTARLISACIAGEEKLGKTSWLSDAGLTHELFVFNADNRVGSLSRNPESAEYITSIPMGDSPAKFLYNALKSPKHRPVTISLTTGEPTSLSPPKGSGAHITLDWSALPCNAILALDSWTPISEGITTAFIEAHNVDLFGGEKVGTITKDGARDSIAYYAHAAQAQAELISAWTALPYHRLFIAHLTTFEETIKLGPMVSKNKVTKLLTVSKAQATALATRAGDILRFETHPEEADKVLICTNKPLNTVGGAETLPPFRKLTTTFTFKDYLDALNIELPSTRTPARDQTFAKYSLV